MAAYDFRVQIATDEEMTFSVNDFRRALADFAEARYGVSAVWIDGDRWDPRYNTLDSEWDSDEGDVRGTLS